VKVIALAVGLSGAIELLQLWVVAGRYSSLRDILANSAGAVLGVALSEYASTLRRPAPSLARRLVIAGAAGLVISNSITAWLLGPSLPEGPWWAQFAPRHQLYSDHFEGTIRGVRLATARLASGNTVDDATVAAVRAEPEIACELTAEIIAGPPTSGVAAIAAVADEHSHVLMLVAQVGDAAMFRVRMRAADVGLSTPSVYVNAALTQPGDSASITGNIRGGRLRIAVRTSSSDIQSDLRLSASWLWSLLIPQGVHVSSFLTGVIAACWLATLVGMLGFWSTRVASTRESRALQLVVALSVCCALALVPHAFALPASDWTEWLSCVCGFVVGRKPRACQRIYGRILAKTVRRWFVPPAVAGAGASSSRR
jgi:VanZ like family